MTEPKAAILIVDDMEESSKVATHVLTRKGYDCVMLDSGQKALDYIENNPVDLILLDIMMPRMDGYETCRRLKCDSRHAEIPVIFLTGLTDIQSISEGFDAGGVDYICKPFQCAELLARVQTHLGMKKLQSIQYELITELQQRDTEKQNYTEKLENITEMVTESRRTHLQGMADTLSELQNKNSAKEIQELLERLDTQRTQMDALLQEVVRLARRNDG